MSSKPKLVSHCLSRLWTQLGAEQKSGKASFASCSILAIDNLWGWPASSFVFFHNILQGGVRHCIWQTIKFDLYCTLYSEINPIQIKDPNRKKKTTTVLEKILKTNFIFLRVGYIKKT